jgi:carboxymethylenebutenolidase
MSFYRGMTCGNVTIEGDKGTPITAYLARPSGPGPFPGVVLVHHLPGWSELYIETTRRFAHHGYVGICANLYEREGGGSGGNPDDVAAKVRAEGGIANSQTGRFRFEGRKAALGSTCRRPAIYEP